MTQTMRFESFGPVLVISIHPNPCCGVKSYIEPKYYYLVEKNNNFLKKTPTYGPNDAKCIVWARSHHLHAYKPSVWCQIMYRT